MTTPTPCNAGDGLQSNNEATFLARLQSQFSDLDVHSFLQGNADLDTNQNGHPSDGDADCTSEDDDDESSLEEPTPEELRAWQEAQYQKGKMHIEAKKIIEQTGCDNSNVHKSALQRHHQWFVSDCFWH